MTIGLEKSRQLRDLVGRALRRLDLDALALLDVDVPELTYDLPARDEDWLRNTLYRSKRSKRELTVRSAQELLLRLFALCSEKGWDLGPRIVIPMLRWREELFGMTEAAALVVLPGEAKRAADDLAAHLEAAFESKDGRGRTWQQQRDIILPALHDYFTRYERLARRVLRRGLGDERQPPNLFSRLWTNDGQVVDEPTLRPRCAHLHPAVAKSAMALQEGVAD